MTQSSENVKEFYNKIFDELSNRIEIEIVPDKDEPYNLNKAMVYTIYDPGPSEGIFLK